MKHLLRLYPALRQQVVLGAGVLRLVTFGFVNERRLRDYPRVVLIGMSIVVLANVAFHQGWRGGSQQILGSDFITLYASGLLARNHPADLYQFSAQAGLEQELIQPTVLPGLNPFISPPYVAWVYGSLTNLPLIWALVAWTAFTLACAALAAGLAMRYLAPTWLRQNSLTARQAYVILLSTLPFVEGLLVGQNHGLTLFLSVGICAASLGGRPYLAGLLAGLLIYKPQFVLGFLILWIVFRQYKACLAFLVTAAAWVGASLLWLGSAPYQAYLAVSPRLLSLPYVAGWPAFLMVTPYGFLATVLPPRSQALAEAGSWICAAAAVVVLIGLALRHHHSAPVITPGSAPMPSAEAGFSLTALAAGPSDQRSLYAFALLVPFLVSPYALLHDLLLLFPALLLWSADRSRAPRLLHVAILTYVGLLLLPLLGQRLGIALLALLPIGLFVTQLTSLRPALPDALLAARSWPT